MTQRNTEALRAFQKWFLSISGPGLTHIPLHQPTAHKDGMITITLYRRNGYQAELCYIPQGRKYTFAFPDEKSAIMAFLGGSFDCDTSTVPNFIESHGRDLVPDRFLEHRGVDPHKPRLEQAHPSLKMAEELRTIDLTNDSAARVVFFSPKGDGVVLVCSFYEDDTDLSSVNYLQMLSEECSDSSGDS